uniref:Nanog homeobox n=1 Tax=Seriola lalandi dorsalis TaxID=1841481 RepID=A0A3B4WV70_SERLL
MADWKAQISYNYNPSYHAYAYGLMYQPAPEQNQGNLTCWGEAGVTDLNNYNTGVTQAYYATTARTRDESPPGSPEQHAVNGHHHYQGSGVVYLGDAQAGRLFRARPHRAAYDARAHGVRRAGSDSTSDSEPHTSPEPWSSSSSRGGSLPQIDSATWTKKDLGNEAGSRSSTASKDVSSSLVEEPQTFAVTRNKRKVRAAFSESQMNALVQRFSVQRYLTPAEMKNLAEMTGLTYKQVKTWFQNRRMKLRRHQKDTSWVSERYTINKDNHYINLILLLNCFILQYQGEAQPQLKEHYNQHMVEAALKKTAPQNVAFYLAAMGSATAVSTRPQATGWSMPPGVGQYEYSPNVFNSSATIVHHSSQQLFELISISVNVT